MLQPATTLYPFLPSGPDFARAIEFFARLGFTEDWQGDGYAGLRFGEAFFILHDINVPEWQQNQMVVYEVPDLMAYWISLAEQELAEHFPMAKIKPPTEYPWGREIHIIDLAGVCWHVRQTGD